MRSPIFILYEYNSPKFVFYFYGSSNYDHLYSKIIGFFGRPHAKLINASLFELTAVCICVPVYQRGWRFTSLFSFSREHALWIVGHQPVEVQSPCLAAKTHPLMFALRRRICQT